MKPLLRGRETAGEAFSLYASCLVTSLSSSGLTFIPLILKACRKLELALQTQQVHAGAMKGGVLSDVYVATALIDAYMKINGRDDALKLFDEIPNKNTASGNAVIGGLRRCGRIAEAVAFLQRLQKEGFLPSAATVAGLLPGCGSLDLGCQLHGLSVKLGYELDDYVSTSLVSSYSLFGQVLSARRVFELLPQKKVVVYNAMISGLSRNGFPSEAVRCFLELMGSPGEKPNASTLVSILSACSDLSELRLGKQIHSYLLKRRQREDEDDAMVGAALISMYFKCGSPSCAHRVFDNLAHRDLPSWNSIISGTLLHGRLDDAVELFQRMQRELKPDATTWNLMISGFSQRGDAARASEFFRMMMKIMTSGSGCKPITSLLQACSATANLQMGKEIHGYALRTSFLYDDYALTSLVTMYMKCGDPLRARLVFDQMEWRPKDVALWNAMISGYGRNGESEAALQMFFRMQEENVKPNAATFLCAISVCSHAGEIEKARELFRRMKAESAVSPTAEHFSCMVDLLGRAGRLEEAWVLVKEMPEPATSAYYSLLGAAACHGAAGVGEEVAEKLYEMDPGSPSPFVLLSKICAEGGRWSDVERLREAVGQKAGKKSPGFSRI